MMAGKSERRNLKNSRARFFGLKSTCLYDCRCDMTSQLRNARLDGQTKNYTTRKTRDKEKRETSTHSSTRSTYLLISSM